jgi:hypothetical protein
MQTYSPEVTPFKQQQHSSGAYNLKFLLVFVLDKFHLVCCLRRILVLLVLKWISVNGYKLLFDKAKCVITLATHFQVTYLQLPQNLLKECKALQNISLHDNPISMDQFQQVQLPISGYFCRYALPKS